MIGNGLRAQIWSEFTRRFQIAQISEFYGSTEGNVGIINPWNKVGSCGVVSVVLSFLNPVRLIKVSHTKNSLQNDYGTLVQPQLAPS